MNDTICAISTAPGVGGIAVCRISGPKAIEVADSIWRGKRLADKPSHTASAGEIADSRGEALDYGVATIYRAPHSFTGEDVVEISVHGSRYVQRELLRALATNGARLAEAGEFTRRAFAAGKMDLAEAEAVADIIASDSRAAHRLALKQMKGGFSRRLAELREELVTLVSLVELELDFSEEDVEFASRDRLMEIACGIRDELGRLAHSFATGAAIKEGIPVAIIGDTNAGKSSLLNRLVGDERAIVSDIHGTTRDTIEETVTIGDYRLRFIDTAGIRDTADAIERLGIDRSIDALRRARIILFVTDATRQINRDLLARALATDATTIVVANKSDLINSSSPSSDPNAETNLPVIHISALTGHGIDSLTDTIRQIISADETSQGDILITNERHAQALSAASASITRVIAGLGSASTSMPPVIAGPSPDSASLPRVIADLTPASIPLDLLSQDIRETLHHLASITGEIPSTEILSTIFSRFCIGK